MKMEKTAAMSLMLDFWENSTWHSWQSFNTVLQNYLNALIQGHIEFKEKDVADIYKTFSGGYWFGCSYNGKNQGEMFYTMAVLHRNINFCRSFEKWLERTAYIVKGNRMYEGRKFYCRTEKYNEFKLIVTGWTEDNKRIRLVAYDKSDWQEKGKKKLFVLDKADWKSIKDKIDLF